MNEDTRKAIQALQDQIDLLREENDRLKNSTTIPLEVAEAFKTRILADAGVLQLASKLASSENINAVTSVNFGGMSVSTNSVLDNPDGFLEVTLAGNLYYIPYYL